MGKDCIFCKIVEGTVPSTKLYEDEAIIAFRDIAPQAPTHILVIPREHREKLSDYGPQDAELLGRLQTVAIALAKQEGLASYRIVINCGRDAGQAVWHLHLHLLGGRTFRWPPG